MSQRTGSNDARWFYPSARERPEALMEEAIRTLERTARLSRTREYRVEAYQGLAAIYLAKGRPEDSLALLRKIVVLQPNNWPASQRMASVLRRLNRPAEAKRALKMGESWLTPEWV
jgi:tetratricopeptide (TPR) repeat protein